MNESKPVKVAILIGTSRPGNYTTKAVRLVVDELEKDFRVAVEVFNPAGKSLPFPGTSATTTDAEELQRMVKEATAVILAASPNRSSRYS